MMDIVVLSVWNCTDLTFNLFMILFIYFFFLPEKFFYTPKKKKIGLYNINNSSKNFILLYFLQLKFNQEQNGIKNIVDQIDDNKMTKQLNTKELQEEFDRNVFNTTIFENDIAMQNNIFKEWNSYSPILKTGRFPWKLYSAFACDKSIT